VELEELDMLVLADELDDVWLFEVVEDRVELSIEGKVIPQLTTSIIDNGAMIIFFIYIPPN
jgi:hypothetical protein